MVKGDGDINYQKNLKPPYYPVDLLMRVFITNNLWRGVIEILIAEDDKFSAMAIKFILEFAGYDVTLAPNGNKAWQILQQESAPKLVVLDWMMPGMSRFDVLHKLREKENKENKLTYVIMLTA